ncbi:MAG: biopolymer transporter ExbD [Armatimonadetes bacterium]|nr:biopolymer transporter ExbD [Armatimonadota bacterium]
MNVVPLVDIALVLLIIFMVTAAFVKEAGLNMQLPKSETAETEPEDERDINIALDKNADLYVDGRQTSFKKLTAFLERRAEKNLNTRVIVKADRAIAYDNIVRVLDVVKLSGLHRVALATEPFSEGPPASAVPMRYDGATKAGGH